MLNIVIMGNKQGKNRGCHDGRRGAVFNCNGQFAPLGTIVPHGKVARLAKIRIILALGCTVRGTSARRGAEVFNCNGQSAKNSHLRRVSRDEPIQQGSSLTFEGSAQTEQDQSYRRAVMGNLDTGKSAGRPADLDIHVSYPLDGERPFHRWQTEARQ